MSNRDSNETRLLIASDLHGSNACFTKLISLALDLRVDGIAVAGDLSGKELFVLEQRNGHYKYSDSFGKYHKVDPGEVESMRRAWGDRGIYSVLENGDSKVSGGEKFSLMSGAKSKRLRQWLDYASKTLERTGASLFIIPGNDDSPEIVEALEERRAFVQAVDGKVVSFREYNISGLGFSNSTPWKTFRELSESEIAQRLKGIGRLLNDMRKAILLVHVPPLGAGLDIAPELKARGDGTLEVVPGVHREVGSTALRDFIQAVNPLLVISGHCHDSQGFHSIGATLCINPGSSYQTGTLFASFLVLEGEKVLGYQSLIR